MSVLTSLARAHAVLAGRAQPIATVRHVHVHERPLVFVPLAMAGEANAPLAAMVGHDRKRPHLLVVPQPRNRDQRFAFAAQLATIVLSYIDSFCADEEMVPADRGRQTRRRFTDAPQLLVPNTGGIEFVRLLGRATRFRRPDGPYAVDERVPVMGRWLTFFAGHAERAGSCLLLAATVALATHWASGQSAVEDQNLAALLGWIDPPKGLTGAEAAARAEDPLICPPAGPVTDPVFDNEILAPLIDRYDMTPVDTPARQHIEAELTRVLAGQLEPTWRLMWRAVDQLRALPPGAHVAQRWIDDREAFTGYVDYLAAGGPPQPRRDSAVAAAQRLDLLERALARYAAQRALDDPIVMAEYRMTGEAFAGTVVATDPQRIDSSGSRRRLRPHVTVATDERVRLEPGAQVTAPSRPRQKGVIVDVQAMQDKFTVTVELTSGMGRALTPEPGSVPEVGEHICYTTLTDTYQPPGSFPPLEETPWTHGGPPTPYVPTDEDAVEQWS